MTQLPAPMRAMYTDISNLQTASVDTMKAITDAYPKVQNYNFPQGKNCIEVVKWIAWRIFDALKSIVGLSDWQIARREIASGLAKSHTINKNTATSVAESLLYLMMDKKFKGKLEKDLGITDNNIRFGLNMLNAGLSTMPKMPALETLNEGNMREALENPFFSTVLESFQKVQQEPQGDEDFMGGAAPSHRRDFSDRFEASNV